MPKSNKRSNSKSNDNNKIKCTEKFFDLNIGNILTNWTPECAISELVANAIDEQRLCNSNNKIEYNYLDNSVIIKDFGRGITYENFVLNENKEKNDNSVTIGQFGIGLKDAISVLIKNDCNITIKTRNDIITFENKMKFGFEIPTIHAKIVKNNNNSMIGTTIIITNINFDIYENVRKNFLIFNQELLLLAKNEFGEIYLNQQKLHNESDNNCNVIYICGYRVATNWNTLFSYNITKNSSIAKDIIRDRLLYKKDEQVWFADSFMSSLEKILIDSCHMPIVLERFAKNLTEELKCTELNLTQVITKLIEFKEIYENKLYTTDNLILTHREVIEQAKIYGFQIIILNNRTYNLVWSNTNIMTVYKFREMLNEPKYIAISISKLTIDEKRIFGLTDSILMVIEAEHLLCTIVISENINCISGDFIEGIYIPKTNTIVIKRSCLKSLAKYSSVLIHECVHALTGFKDLTQSFENALTNMTGKLFDYYVNDCGSWLHSDTKVTEYIENTVGNKEYLRIFSK